MKKNITAGGARKRRAGGARKKKPVSMVGRKAEVYDDVDEFDIEGLTEEERFDLSGMSPLWDVHLRTPIGRPRKFDLDQISTRTCFEAACRMHATVEEIAHLFGLDVKNLYNAVKRHYGTTFAKVYNLKKSEGKISLRRAQWMTALRDKVPSMLVWLGKQELGQRDRFELPVGAPEGDGEPMVFYLPVFAGKMSKQEPKPDQDNGVHVSDE